MEFISGVLENSEGNERLKVLITYAPDNASRPMGAPMKNGAGLYTFPFRTSCEMRLYDAKENLIF